MSRNVYPCISANGLWVLVLIPVSLARWIDNLYFLSIVDNTESDRVLTYVPLRCEQEVDWSCVDPEDPFFLYRWRTREEIGWAENCVLEHKQKIDGQFVYQYCTFPSISVGFKSDI